MTDQPLPARALAEQIARDIQPMTALHVGCGRGLLVAALRQQCARAWGIDTALETDAIEPAVREHCFICLPFDPLPRRYDLIVCLGALAQLPKLDVDRAIANLCAYGEGILFSPTGLANATPATPALSVPSSELFQLTEYWAERFARHGFFHEVFFDASFAGSGATLYRKLRGSITQVIRNYEQRNREMTVLTARIEQGRFMRMMRRAHELRMGLERVNRGARTHTRMSAALPLRTDDADYQTWIAAHEPGATELEQQRQHHFAYHPLISIITPVFDPPPQALREAIESVLAQTYANWELCLVDGGSEEKEVRAILESYACKEPRIHVEFLETNRGISGNSNAALRMATGDFALLFDHDDLLAPFALHEIVGALNETPGLDIICFDEDKVTADSATRLQPMFRPSRWSPELNLSANTLTHSAVRRTLIEQVGRFDPATDGAQDWDLLLRCAEKTDRIRHIPKILYHWRTLPNSAAVAGKPWAVEMQPQVIVNHLKRIGLTGVSARILAPGLFQLVWPVHREKVSIIIPTRDNTALLRRCMRSLLALTAYSHFEVIVIDTGSTDPRAPDYYAELASEPRVRVLHSDAPFNYSAVNNLGARHATGAHLLFLNDDVEALEPDWLEEMLRWSQRAEIGAVGVRLLYPEGTIQHAGIVIGLGHLFAHAAEDFNTSLFGGPNWYRNVSAVTGACMMMRRDVFDAAGGFDERFSLAFGDVDLCLRITEAGLRIVYTPFARLRHQEGATRANFVPEEDHVLADQKVSATFGKGDPFFNPNLDTSSKIPRLRLTNLGSHGSLS